MSPKPRQLASLLCGAAVTLILGADWLRFRGPDGAAVSQETGLPTKWSLEENLVWRTKLPGAGTSSPITVKDRIFLTTYTGYGLSQDDPGDMDDLKRHVVCLNRADGKILWTRQETPNLPESRYQGNGARHGYSSSTPTSDGQRLFVFFGNTGVYCFDLDGAPLWRTDVGSGQNGWGSSNSLLLYKDLLIVNASIESKSLVALDKSTGKEVWRAGGIRGSWNTPVLVEAPGGGAELVLCIPQTVLGFDPDTGKELWRCDGIPDRGYVCPSVVAHDGVVYAIGGRKNTALAVRAGGRGDVTKTHELWRTNKGSNVSSPVYYQGHLYWMHEKQGIFFCLDAKNGQTVFAQRVAPRPGGVYSSALAADGKIYCVSQHDGTFVFAAKPEYELLAHNVFADDDSRCNACPAVSDGQLLLRSDTYLYCVGKK